MPRTPAPLARVVLLGGPSGSGKSRLAQLSGLPLLRLDDFYRSGDDPLLPRLAGGEVDWDHPGSWHRDQALAALVQLARTGRAEVPNYSISANGPVGTRMLDLDGATRFVAEGVFVAEVIDGVRAAGILEDAVCVKRSRWVTAILRFVRDVRERRKPIPILIRRGIRLARHEAEILAHLRDAGFRGVSFRGIRRLLAGT